MSKFVLPSSLVYRLASTPSRTNFVTSMFLFFRYSRRLMPTPTDEILANVSFDAPSIGLISVTPSTFKPTYGKVLNRVKSTSSKLLSQRINLSESLLTIDVSREGVSTNQRATTATTTTSPKSEHNEIRVIFQPFFIFRFSFLVSSPIVLFNSSAIIIPC